MIVVMARKLNKAKARAEMVEMRHALLIIAGVLLGVSLSSQSAFATEVVCLADPDMVLLASDSLARVTRRGISHPEKACKLRQEGEHFWATSGPVIIEATRFDSDKFVRKAIKRKLGPYETAKLVGELINRPLQKAFSYLKTQPNFYHQLELNDGSILSVVIVFRGSIRLDVSWISLKIIKDTVVPQEPGVCETRCAIAFGPKNVTNYVRTHAQEFAEWRQNPGGVIDYLMKMGEAADPEDVGPPFVTLAVTPERVRWLGRQDGCPDIESPPFPSKKRVHPMTKRPMQRTPTMCVVIATTTRG
jgi:hypothetical protein